MSDVADENNDQPLPVFRRRHHYAELAMQNNDAAFSYERQIFQIPNSAVGFAALKQLSLELLQTNTLLAHHLNEMEQDLVHMKAKLSHEAQERFLHTFGFGSTNSLDKKHTLTFSVSAPPLTFSVKGIPRRDDCGVIKLEIEPSTATFACNRSCDVSVSEFDLRSYAGSICVEPPLPSFVITSRFGIPNRVSLFNNCFLTNAFVDPEPVTEPRQRSQPVEEDDNDNGFNLMMTPSKP